MSSLMYPEAWQLLELEYGMDFSMTDRFHQWKSHEEASHCIGAGHHRHNRDIGNAILILERLGSSHTTKAASYMSSNVCTTCNMYVYNMQMYEFQYVYNMQKCLCVSWGKCMQGKCMQLHGIVSTEMRQLPRCRSCSR